MRPGGSQGSYVQHPTDDLNGKFSHLVDDAQALVAKTPAYFGNGKQHIPHDKEGESK